MAVSDGRPSRRKNPPGILPAAYIRSSTSTVSGKKSIPSRGAASVHVARTWVSPRVTTHEPAACLASLPVSTTSSAPPRVLLDLITVCLLETWPQDRGHQWIRGGAGRGVLPGQFSVVGPGDRANDPSGSATDN